MAEKSPELEAAPSEAAFAQTQRLKAALHYSIGKTYEEVASDHGMKVNREMMAAVTEMVYEQCRLVSHDLELFAKHAKRTTVNTDDVLLMCRRNPSLVKLMREEAEKLKSLKEQGKEKAAPGEKRKGGRVKKKELPIILDDDDDD